MRFFKTIGTALLLLALGTYFFYRVDVNRRKRSPELFYGRLELVEPITGGFNYALDGGSITVTMTDVNDVKLNVFCSPPGGMKGNGNTEVYVGLRQEVWSQKAKQIKRGSDEAKQVSGYVRALLQSIKAEVTQEKAKGIMEDRELLKTILGEQTRMCDRVVEILTTTKPLREEWGLLPKRNLPLVPPM